MITKPPISLVLATAENCQLGCKGCPTGRTNLKLSREKPGVGQMTTEMAERIVQKAKAEAHVLSVCLYYFNEPFLLSNFLDLITLFKRENLYIFLSTNLSFSGAAFEAKLEALMALEPENIIVSLSGWTQETYERYHTFGRVELVKQNMEKMAGLRRPNTFLRMSWHDFDYNRHEKNQAEEFAREHGFCFTPYGVGVLPLERVEETWARFEIDPNYVDPAEKDILVPLRVAKDLCYERRGWNCQMQQQTVTVDADGTVYNCSDRYGKDNWRGSFFDRTVTEILDARKQDATCLACKAKGAHIYGAQEYTTPRFSLRRWLDMPYRALRLQGVYQKLNPHWWRRTVESHYERPHD